MTEITVRVPGGELRRALTAVLPHAGCDDTLPGLTCVKFEASGGWLYVAATDRYSMAAARMRVPVAADGTAAEASALLRARDAKALRRLLKGTAGDSVFVTFPQARLAVSADGGFSCSLPAQDGKFPDWRRLMASVLAAEPMELGDGFGVHPGMLARFTRPEESWNEPACMRVVRGGTSRTGTALPAVVFTRGGWFAGTLMSARVNMSAASGWPSWAEVAGEPAGELAAEVPS